MLAITQSRVRMSVRVAGTVRRLELGLEAHGFFRRIDDLIDINREGATLRARNVGADAMTA